MTIHDPDSLEPYLDKMKTWHSIYQSSLTVNPKVSSATARVYDLEQSEDDLYSTVITNWI